MFNNLFEHRLSKNDGFSLTPERLVYQQKSSAAPENRAEIVEKDMDTIKAKIEEEKKKYNKEYGKKPDEPYGKPLELDLSNPDKALKEIEAVLKTPYKYDGIEYTLEERAPSDKRLDQPAALKKLRKLLEGYKKVAGSYEKAKEGVRETASRALVRENTDLQKILDTKTELEKNENYKDLLADYKQVFSGLLGRDPDFKRFYLRTDGTVDAYLERENQQLFFAILSEQTCERDKNGKIIKPPFSTNFVLGQNFGDNFEENKKNFPFIYHEWVKRQFDTKAIDSAKAEVASKTKEAGLASPDESEAKVKDSVEFLNKKIRTTASLPSELLLPDPLKGLPTKKDVHYYDAYKKALGSLQTDISLTIDKLEKSNFRGYGKEEKDRFIKRLKKTKDEFIPIHIGLAEAQRQLKYQEETMEDIDKKFVRKELRKKENRQVVLELAMLQFQKAMQVVDQPFKQGGDFSRVYHPAVRRLLIATVYREGVAKMTPSGKYIDDVSPEYTWLISKLAKSPYFYKNLKEKFLDSEQREFLILARYANLALFNTKYLEEEIIKKLEANEKGTLTQLRRDLAVPAAQRNADVTRRITDNIAKINVYTSREITEANVLTVIEDEKTRLKLWQNLYNEAESLMANPDKNKIRAFIEKMKTGRTLDPKMGNRDFIRNFASYAEAVDTNYNAQDFRERSSGNYLDQMGIKPEGVYLAYVSYWKKHKDMKVDQWDNHLLTKDGAGRLIDMFRQILPHSSVYKGKENFLKVLESLQGKNPLATKPELRDDQAIALNIFKMLQVEIQHREKISAASAAGNAEALDKLEGMTFGDKVTDYAKGVLNMLIGPGQSIANRAAGAAILIMAWKAAQKAYKGEGKMGKGLRVLFLAGAAELALKHVTGEGVLDKLRITGVVKALEEKKTYESVLLARARENFEKEDITPNQHAKALMKLKNVPFGHVMTWYEEVNKPGMEQKVRHNEKVPKQAGLSFLKIEPYEIVGGEVKNEELRRMHAHLVIKRTIENFFGYVGNKDQRDAVAGKDRLKEIWIDGIKDKKFSPEHAKFADRGLPPELIEELRRYPKSVTWQMVMQAEIRPSDVEEVSKQDPLTQVKDYFMEKGAALERWTRQDVLQPASAKWEKAVAYIKTDFGPKALDLIGELGDAGATGLKVGMRNIELWYKGNKYAIRQFGRQHWELVAEAIKFPFAVIYATDQMVVPFITTKIKQTHEILRSDKLRTLPANRDLQAQDIMRPSVIAALRAGLLPRPPAGVMTMKSYEIFDKNKNPEITYFGVYQKPFLKALTDGTNYYENQTDDIVEYGPRNIGYYITDVTQQGNEAEMGIKPTDSPENRFQAMRAYSREQAKKFYITKGVPPEDIDRFMYDIHKDMQSAAPGENSPRKLYMFWRMPLTASREYQLKHADRWPDYFDPNEHKFRPPFIVDPSKGILDNLKAAYGFQSPALREGIGYTTMVISQWLRLMMGVLEGAGTAAIGIMSFLPKVQPRHVQWIADLTRRDPKTLEAIDEYSGSAGNAKLATSEFYKNPTNAKIYKEALEYARKTQQDLNLETDPNGRPLPWAGVGKKTGKIGPGFQDLMRPSRERENPDWYNKPAHNP